MRHSVLFLSFGIALEVLSVGMTLGSVSILERLTQEQRTIQFNRVVERAVVNARGRLVEYETALRAAVGLYDASASVERHEWKAFVRALNLETNFPSSLGFGHITRVAPGGEAAFVERERADNYPEFEIKSLGPSSGERFVVNTIEPLLPNLAAIGMDISSETRRREAALASMATGQTRITGIVSLVQDNFKRPGFLMLTPHYSTRNVPATAEERRATCTGWTYAPFTGANILEDLLDIENEGVVISIFETSVSPENCIADGGPGIPGGLSSQQRVKIGGHEWVFVAQTTAAFESSSVAPATWVVLTIGFATTTGLLVVLLLMHRHSIRALRRADAATEEAKRAGEAKARFLAVMSHEIRTPLNGVIGMAELALLEDMPAEVRKQISIIQSSGHTLLALVNDILDFSRFSAGNIPLETLPFNASLEINTVSGLLGEKAKAKGLRLYIHVPPEVWVRGDALRFRQIVLNLLGNALKFTEAGKVEVTLVQSDSGLEMTVSDTGIGMDEGALARLFQPFSQADATTSRRFGGSGLGLAIAKQLVDCMHGRISARSVAGKGSTFFVHLPLPPMTSAPVEAPVQPKAEVVHFGLRVLLAEDVETNQMVASAMLGKLGCTVTVALNGVEAIERVAGHDLILMDCHMPEMDGLEATRRLRAAGCTLPIVALTANASLEDQAACLAAGMNAFLTKPLAKAALTRTLAPYAK